MAANDNPNPSWPLTTVTHAGDVSPDRGRGTGEETPRLPELEGYTIGEEIGRGGMGVVYKAQQVRANRTVALKVIHPRLLAGQTDRFPVVLERFRTEGQAAARVEHDNVVAVYDVGEQAGQAYFAMRFVDGQSLSQLLRDGPLDERTAAKFMLDVARGVDACHQAGILHRDLKPGNVLLDSANERALVSDFGLAKMLDSPSDLTEAGQTPATPMYAAPEQLIDSKSVTAAADIYSLGATLYHMLTGRPPFYANSHAELLQQVLNDEPVRPTTLNPAVSRDLETICLKCLDKTPRARYESTRELADDLKRFCVGEPIQARRITQLDRTVKWAKRHPAVASLTAALAVTAIIGFFTVAWQWRRAEGALEVAEHERMRTEENFELASNALDSIVEFADDPRLESYGLEGYRKDMLARVRPYYTQLVRQKGSDTSLLAKQASAYYGLGRMAEILGEAEAREAYEESFQLYSRLVETDPRELEYQLGRARALRRLSQLAMRLKRYDEAESFSRTAIRSLEQVDERLRRDTDYQFELASNCSRLAHVLLLTKRIDKAEQFFRRSLAMFQSLASTEQRLANNENELADTHTNLGMLYLSTGQLERALEELREAVGILENLVSEFPGILEFNNDLCVGYHHLARCLDMLAISEQDPDMRKQALDYFDKMLTRREGLVSKHPGRLDLRQDLARGQFQVAEMHFRDEEFEQAERTIEKAKATWQQIVDTFGFPESHIVPSLHRLAMVHRQLGQVGLARKELQREMDILKPLVAQTNENSFEGSNEHKKLFLGHSYLELGILDFQEGLASEAVQWLTKAISVLRAVDPTVSPATGAATMDGLAKAYSTRALAFEQLGEVEQAKEDRRHAEQLGNVSPR